MKLPIEAFLYVLCDPFPTLGKKKGYIDEYGLKTTNSTKMALFVCVQQGTTW